MRPSTFQSVLKVSWDFKDSCNKLTTNGFMNVKISESTDLETKKLGEELSYEDLAGIK